MGWMTRLSTKKMDDEGRYARLYRAPEGTIFRSKKCVLTYLADQGREEERLKVKSMGLHRKRTLSQVFISIQFLETNNRVAVVRNCILTK